MILAIDVGNTNTVLGMFQGKAPHELVTTWRISTHPLPTADELRAKLKWLFHIDGVNGDQFEAVVVSSVVPAFSETLRQAFSPPRHSKRLEIIDSRSPFCFSIQASPPSQVGADRLVNAEAAVREYGAPCIIVDSGTATTLCAIDETKAYLGGAIMPGLELSVESLAKKAAQLFRIELTPPDHAIGANTTEALRSGIMLGYASMIDGMIEQFKSEMVAKSKLRNGNLTTERIRVIGTGGICERLKTLTKNIQQFDSNLTLKGIAHVYESIAR